MPVSVVDDVTKVPNAQLWYGFDLRAKGWMAAADTIASAVWTITQESGVESGGTIALLKPSNTLAATNTQLLVKLTAGTLGLDYIVTGKWTTTDGDVDERSIRIRCRAR